jgi:DNA repair protein RadC
MSNFFVVADSVGPEYDACRVLTHPQSVSTAELLSTALDMSIDYAWELVNSLSDADLFDPDGTLYRRLRQQEPTSLDGRKGMTEKRIRKFAAIQELTKRLYAAPAKHFAIDDPIKVVELLSSEIAWSEVENFAVVALNIKHVVLAIKVISRGSRTETVANPRSVFDVAFKFGADRLIVAHNHPSHSCEPSPEDISLTETLLLGAAVLHIPILDHLILGGSNWCSMRQHTALWKEIPSAA